jgi:hypothetical protein
MEKKAQRIALRKTYLRGSKTEPGGKNEKAYFIICFWKFLCLCHERL